MGEWGRGCHPQFIPHPLQQWTFYSNNNDSTRLTSTEGDLEACGSMHIVGIADECPNVANARLAVPFGPFFIQDRVFLF